MLLIHFLFLLRYKKVPVNIKDGMIKAIAKRGGKSYDFRKSVEESPKMNICQTNKARIKRVLSFLELMLESLIALFPIITKNRIVNKVNPIYAILSPI